MTILKMICCLPIFSIGAAFGVIRASFAEGYEWGREEFFEN